MRGACPTPISRHGAPLFQKKLREVQEQHAELWSSAAVHYAQDYPRLAVRVQELEVHLKVLKVQVKAVDADMAELRRLLAPPPPMAQGIYGHRMRFMAMELMGKANVCATQVPRGGIVARFYGIHIPVRVKGNGDDAHILPWVPCPSTCLRVRCEMGPCRSSKWASTSSRRAAPRAFSPSTPTAPPPTALRCRPLC